MTDGSSLSLAENIAATRQVAELAHEAGEALQACSQRRKFLIALHDGDPVDEGSDGDDLALSHARIRRLERAGIAFICVYLGDDIELIAKLKRLFPRFIICSNNDPPNKLGNLLKSLV